MGKGDETLPVMFPSKEEPAACGEGEAARTGSWVTV